MWYVPSRSHIAVVTTFALFIALATIYEGKSFHCYRLFLICMAERSYRGSRQFLGILNKEFTASSWVALSLYQC